MERLTKINEHGTAHFYPQCFEKCEGIGYSRKCDDCDFLDKVCDKLGEYEDLEEQGKLFKLLCAAGDTVWYISEKIEKQGRKKITAPFVEKGMIDNVTIGCMMIPQITVCNDENIWTTFDCREDFGKIVFLTYEEAKAALEELTKEVAPIC